MPPVSPGNPGSEYSGPGFTNSLTGGKKWNATSEQKRKYHIYMTYETQTELLDAIKKEAEE